jgi:anti-sigma regulatory factor (Ser/Thr protein kinase)
MRLPRLPDSVGRARAFVAQSLAGCIEPTGHDVVDATSVSVSELVTNAVRYGAGDITVDLVIHRDAVDLTVIDGGPDRPQPRQPGPGAESGRGLLLVEAFCSAWGTRPIPEGKAVWCRLALVPSVTGVTCDVNAPASEAAAGG